MVDNDEEGRPPVGDALGPGPGDDAPLADGLVGDDPLGEVGPHGPAELPLEPGGAEGEDAGDVGVDALVVEGRDGLGEPAREPDLGGGGVGEPFVRGEGDDLEGEDGEEKGDGGDGESAIPV